MPWYLLGATGGVGAERPGCGREATSHGASRGDLAAFDGWALEGEDAIPILIDMSPPGGINADSRVGRVYSIVRDTTDGS